MTDKGLKVSYHVEHSIICKYCPDHDKCCQLKKIREIIILKISRNRDVHENAD